MIKFVRDDIFRVNISEATVVYMVSTEKCKRSFKAQAKVRA
jgi:hypothetical protein